MTLTKVVITPETGTPEVLLPTSQKAKHVGDMLRSLRQVKVRKNVISGGKDKGTTTLSAEIGGKRYVGYYRP